YVAIRRSFLLTHIGLPALSIRLNLIMIHNDVGPFFLILSILLLYFFFLTSSRFLRFIYLFNLLLLAALIFLTYSRNLWLCYLLAISSFVAFHFKNHKKFFLTPLIVLLFFAFLTYFSPVRSTVLSRVHDISSLKHRVVSWNAGLKTVANHPFFGVGWLNYY